MSQPSAPPPPGGGEAPPPTPPPAPQATSGSSDSNRTVMLVLSYLGLLALIPWLVEKNDSEVQWHAKNGLVFTAAMIVIWIVATVLAVVPVLGWIVFFFAYTLLPLAWLIFAILGIVKATQGQRLVVPVLSDFVAKF